jgi:hypothetical protein
LWARTKRHNDNAKEEAQQLIEAKRQSRMIEARQDFFITDYAYEDHSLK